MVLADTAKPDYQTFAVMEANIHGIPPADFVNTLECESTWDPNAVGDTNTSFGIAQWHLPAHTSKDPFPITKEQALDPYFSISYAAAAFQAGYAHWWTCYNNLHKALI